MKKRGSRCCFLILGDGATAAATVRTRANTGQAEQSVTVATTPTPSDLYCSGFITTEKIPEAATSWVG